MHMFFFPEKTRWHSDGSVVRNGFVATVACDETDAPADATTADFYAPLSPCNDLGGHSCTSFVGSSLSVFGVTFRQDPQSVCSNGVFRTSCCFCGQRQDSNSCDMLQDLTGLAEGERTHSDSLDLRGDFFSLSCAPSNDGPEAVFALAVPSGYRLTIGMDSNSYDSRHELRIGGDCPGDTVVQCIDDPDLATMSVSNTGADDLSAYFIVGAYSAASIGDLPTIPSNDIPFT